MKLGKHVLDGGGTLPSCVMGSTTPLSLSHSYSLANFPRGGGSPHPSTPLVTLGEWLRPDNPAGQGKMHKVTTGSATELVILPGPLQTGVVQLLRLPRKPTTDEILKDYFARCKNEQTEETKWVERWYSHCKTVLGCLVLGGSLCWVLHRVYCRIVNCSGCACCVPEKVEWVG